MKSLKNSTTFAFLCAFIVTVFSVPTPGTEEKPSTDDKYRPKIHFSISKSWINDPNGMVYLDGEYHLYYQYNPNSSVWGPMHWGHSVSTDLVTWTELPIALAPDNHGQIWSGSAVADICNSGGFKTGDKTPIVAVFTNAEGPNNQPQQQSIAYSNDNGRTYTKFQGNPVIQNPQIKDFRDPKVIRYNNENWVLVLAAGNKVMFYESKDLKAWKYLSEFGNLPSQGSHSGVWECPDLLEIKFGNDTFWLLLVSINPGGPNSGSVTQYFLGNFDGQRFFTQQKDPLWMDWGADNYAGVTFFNDPQKRHVMMAWMNNWDYAGTLPTNGWRGQMTLPRVLGLKIAAGQLRLQSTPVHEIEALYNPCEEHKITNSVEIKGDQVFSLSDQLSWSNPLMYMDFTFDIKDFGKSSSIAICFLNSLKQEVCTGYDNGRERNIFLDRTRSGVTNFSPKFILRPTAVREIGSNSIRFQIYLDVSAIEVFVDSGLTCLTNLFYTDEPFTKVEIRHHGKPENSKLVLSSAAVQGLKSMSEI